MGELLMFVNNGEIEKNADLVINFNAYLFRGIFKYGLSDDGELLSACYYGIFPTA